MNLRPGTRVRSAVCDTEVVVVRAPTDSVDLRCGGHPMVAAGGDAPASAVIEPAHADGTQLGKRYADEELGFEALCVKAGEGSLSIGDTPLAMRGAKPLPSSD
jgi:hypothetical protein